MKPLRRTKQQPSRVTRSSLRSRSIATAPWALVSRALLCVFAAQPTLAQDSNTRAEPVDVVVYGATPAGIMAAVAAARAGRSVRLLEPSAWVGGMVSGGLSNTDTGQRGAEAISGLAAEFFDRVRMIEEQRGVCIGNCASSYFFEPSVAERVFEDMLREASVNPERAVSLSAVAKNGTTITSVDTSAGRVSGAVFIELRRRPHGPCGHSLCNRSRASSPSQHGRRCGRR
jgi:hypothetical protein